MVTAFLLDHPDTEGHNDASAQSLRVSRCFGFDAAFALLLASLFPASALGDEIFAGVGNYGSGGEGATAVIRQAAQGVADRLIAQSSSFVLSLGDVLYGTYPSNTYFEFQPLGPTGNPSFAVAVGDLYGQYIKQSALVPSGGTEMNFFPVIGDHDWHHETIQIDVATGKSICTETPDCVLRPRLQPKCRHNDKSDVLHERTDRIRERTDLPCWLQYESLEHPIRPYHGLRQGHDLRCA
jgi:hypothetical protein